MRLAAALIAAIFAAAAYGIARQSRQLERRRLKDVLQTWEGEGGNPSPAESPTIALPGHPLAPGPEAMNFPFPSTASQSTTRSSL
jgi:hypothetical protein